jgi:glycine oxidase
MHTDSDRRHCVVVGGGITGCATAYFLARAGLHCVLIERDAIAAHASRCNAGNLNPLYETPAQLLPLALESFRLHRRLLADLSEIGCARYQLHSTERIHLGCADADLLALESSAHCLAQAEGFSTRRLGRGELHEIEPGLADHFTGGLKISGNLSVESPALARSLVDGAARWGATILSETVEGILTHASRVTGVRTQRSVVPCNDVVFATGPWVARLEHWLGIRLPIEPVKGELLLMRVPRGAPRHDLHWGSKALYVRGRDHVLVGGTLQKCGLDAAPTPEAKSLLLQGAALILPQMRDAVVEDHFAALRPISASSLPIAERAAGWENAYIANGGGSKGILLSVVIAKLVRDLLLASGARPDRAPWEAGSEASYAA